MVLIGLGGNLPHEDSPPRDVLERAVGALMARGLVVLRRSAWYRTPAWPAGAGPDFVNGVLAAKSALAPQALLGVLHAVEAQFGRARSHRWAARSCDLDLLAVGSAIAPDGATVRAWMGLTAAEQVERVPPGLLLPHPRLHERPFVLVPLAEIAPDWMHPVLGEPARALLARLAQRDLASIARL